MIDRLCPVPNLVLLVITTFSFVLAKASAQPPAPPASRDITELSLEDLLAVHVTSVSKKEQALSKVAAALYVITREDILSSGVNNIPDLLRLVPGVEVAQIASSRWAIGIRGFNSLYANKVLVLIDGRTVYMPAFSGVLWDQQLVPLEDIERIEVIRGPGGTVWGANAVNGVINIITRNSQDTPGGLVTVGAGSRETAEGLMQYGGSASAAAAYRVFARHFDVGNSMFPGGRPAADGWRGWQGGFRSDFNPASRDALTVEGDILTTTSGATSLATFASPQVFQAAVNSIIDSTSGNLLASWRHTLAGGSETSLHVYYDHIRLHGYAGADFLSDTFDADFGSHLALGARHDVVWGTDFRVNRDDARPYAGYSIGLNPPQRTAALFSVFLQDEFQLANALFLTAGSKFEHNAFTGFEYEPSAQIVWTPQDRHTLWISAARAIRQPDRVDFDAQFNLGVVPANGALSLLTISGSHRVKAEQLLDFEAGYRSQIGPRLLADVAVFLSRYRRLETEEPGAPFPAGNAAQPYLVLPLTFSNLARARDYGLEMFLDWIPSRRWRLSPGYSFLHMAVNREAGSGDLQVALIPGQSPRHQLQMRSTLGLGKNLEWGASARYVSSLPGFRIGSYLGVDTNLIWRLAERIEVSVAGQNLLSPRRLEFTDLSNTFLHTAVERSVFGKLTRRF